MFYNTLTQLFIGGLEGCSPYIQKALKKLIFYPFILVFCYALVSFKNVSDIQFPHKKNYTDFFGNGADLMLCLQVIHHITLSLWSYFSIVRFLFQYQMFIFVFIYIGIFHCNGILAGKYVSGSSLVWELLCLLLLLLLL